LTVFNTNDAGSGSLRQAILDANATTGADTITFDIPGAGVQTISPLSALPPLTDNAGVTIDGYTQPGARPNARPVGNNAVLLVELSGLAGGIEGFAIVVRSSSNRIRGLVINGFGMLGSSGGGVSIEDGSNNRVAGCFLGTDATGTVAKPNNFGVMVEIAFPLPGPTGTTIGGTSPAERNVVSGNASSGVLILANAGPTSVIGNYVGTNASGTAALGNGLGGVVASTCAQLVIGGTAARAGNLISGNTNAGIILSAIDGAVVQGNRIGTNALGTAALPNETGIQVAIGGAGFLIGGASPGAGNLISGNTRGVRLFVPGGTTLESNLIGTDVSGKNPLGNLEEGVLIHNPGSTATVYANVIAFNGTAGVAVGIDASHLPPAIVISRNSIHDNGGPGITSVNNQQNFPVLSSAISEGPSTDISGTLAGPAGTAYTIEFFSNPTCDDSGSGEGQAFLGAAPVVTDGTGIASFRVSLHRLKPAEEVVTATATVPAGNTSEFSPCVPVTRSRPGHGS
jgi:hypothetical protein